MHGCVKISERLLLQEVSIGGENRYRNIFGEGDTCVRTWTMLLVLIAEEA